MSCIKFLKDSIVPLPFPIKPFLHFVFSWRITKLRFSTVSITPVVQLLRVFFFFFCCVLCTWRGQMIFFENVWGMSLTLHGIIHASRLFFTQLTFCLHLSFQISHYHGNIEKQYHFVPGQALISRIAVTAVENPLNVWHQWWLLFAVCSSCALSLVTDDNVRERRNVAA